MKRKFRTSAELIELTEQYFNDEPFIMIETYYPKIGITKLDYRNGKTSPTPKYQKYAEIISEARERIRQHLARVIVYGQTESELSATKRLKGKGKVTTYEYDTASKNMLAHYMKSRFKDNGEGEVIKDTDKVTINIGNTGPNSILSKDNEDA